jgi:hypothetical protein
MKNLLFIIIAFSLISIESLASPKTEADYGYTTSMTKKVHLHADGTAEWKLSYEFQILDNNGKGSFTKYRINFKPQNERIENIKAEVINDGISVSIDPQNIMEEKLSSESLGYDEMKTYTIPFPQVKVGSIIKLSYNQTVFRSPHFDHLSQMISLTFDEPIKRLQYNITIDDGITYEVNDKTKIFKNENLDGQAKSYWIEKQNTDNKTRELIFYGENVPSDGYKDETSAYYNYDRWSYIVLSSFKDFNDVSQTALPRYEAKINQPLPESLKPYLGDKPENPLTEKQAYQKLLKIFKKVSTDFRYFGDWRSVDGGYVPRDLKDIAITKYGDCKDFAILGVIIARHLGLEAHPAFVKRGSTFTPRFSSIPNFNFANHAITWIKKPGSDEGWWIDLTNPVPNIGITPFDISGREAVIMRKENPYVMIPINTPDESVRKIKTTYDISDYPNLITELEFSLSGVDSWWQYNSTQELSPLKKREGIIDYAGVDLQDVENLETSDVTQSQTTGYLEYQANAKFEERQGLSRSGDLIISSVLRHASAAYSVSNVKIDDQVSDLKLYHPRTILSESVWKRGSFQEVVGEPYSCDIKSPWFDWKRTTINQPDQDLVVKDEIKIKADRIPNREIKTEYFRKLAKEVENCLSYVKVVLR